METLNNKTSLESSSFIVFKKEKQKILGNSLSLFLFGQGCCSLDLLSSDFSADVNISIKDSPKHCDVLIVSGVITNKSAYSLRKVYEQISFPKWVVSIGSCAGFGGFYSSYSLTKGADSIIPVDIHAMGCPPDMKTLLEVFNYITRKTI